MTFNPYRTEKKELPTELQQLFGATVPRSNLIETFCI